MTEDGQESLRSVTGEERHRNEARRTKGTASDATALPSADCAVDAFRKFKKAHRTLYRSDRSFHFQSGDEIRRQKRERQLIKSNKLVCGYSMLL